MTVFVAHAPADSEGAESLEKALERRGQFVELDDGQTALRPVQASDVVVLLISKDFVFAPTRLRLEQRALDAWTSNRLLVIKLDHGIAPIGLRDLPAIDASFAAQREFKWQEVAAAIREKLKSPIAPADSESVPQAPRAPKKVGGGPLGALLALVLVLPGLGALAALGSIWLVNRIGPVPGSLRDLRVGVEAFGMRYGVQAGVTEWIFAAALSLLLLVLAVLVARAFAPPRRAVRREAPAVAPPPSDAVFVSYARANEAAVLPVIEAAQREGRKFWLDQQGLVAGDGWAGEIVRAIKGAASVVVMCSKAAFESDHVKREIYLADRYRKKLTPVYIEQAEPPEDFEYFFAGVQTLNLFETPEAERSQALIKALGAAP
jgi:hypothetical protein